MKRFPLWQVLLAGALNDIPELYMVVMFCRRILLVAYDQVYTIDFLINEQQRGDRFEQGYEHFFESLKIVPRGISPQKP